MLEKKRNQFKEQQASSTKLLEQQATSVKPQAQRFKRQAKRIKRQDSWSWKKFHGTRTEVLNADKSIVWMLHMERNLMRWERHLVTPRNFKFYCKKVAASITTQ